jgi:hypothetical protein
MRYWNPVRVSMWAPMVKHRNFVLDLPDQNCARGLRRQHSLPLLPIWKLVHSQTLGLWIAYESLCARALLAYMKARALANDWLMISLWKLVRLYMMSMSNVTWMRYMTTYCVSLQLALMDELCLLVRVLLCLFLSWQATSKVVQCWTKRLTYCCVKHKKFRLTAPRPQVPLPLWRLGSTLWCDVIAARRNCLWSWFLVVCLAAGPVAYAWFARWVYCLISLMMVASWLK